MIETKEYIVNGVPHTVSIDQEEQFLKDNKKNVVQLRPTFDPEKTNSSKNNPILEQDTLKEFLDKAKKKTELTTYPEGFGAELDIDNKGKKLEDTILKDFKLKKPDLLKTQEELKKKFEEEKKYWDSPLPPHLETDINKFEELKNQRLKLEQQLFDPEKHWEMMMESKENAVNDFEAPSLEQFDPIWHNHNNLVTWFNAESSYKYTDTKLEIAETAGDELTKVTVNFDHMDHSMYTKQPERYSRTEDPFDEFEWTGEAGGEVVWNEPGEGDAKRLEFNLKGNPFVINEIQTHIKEHHDPNLKEENLKYLSNFFANGKHSLYFPEDDWGRFAANLNILKSYYQQAGQKMMSADEMRKSQEDPENQRQRKILDELPSMFDGSGWGYDMDHYNKYSDMGFNPEVDWEKIDKEELQEMQDDPQYDFLFNYDKPLEWTATMDFGDFSLGIDPDSFITPQMIEQSNRYSPFDLTGSLKGTHDISEKEINAMLEEFNSMYNIQDVKYKDQYGTGTTLASGHGGGFLVLPNGEKVSYNYIFNLLPEIQAYQEKDFTQNFKKSALDGTMTEDGAWSDFIEEHGLEKIKSGEVNIDNINMKDHGREAMREEVLYQELNEGMDSYMLLQPDGEENVEIARLRDRLKEIEKDYIGDEPIDKDPEYKNVKNRLEKTIDDLGYNNLELYDDDFNFIGASDNWEHEGEFFINKVTGEKLPVGLGDQNKAVELAEVNDLHNLKSLYNDKYAELVNLCQVMAADYKRVWRTDGYGGNFHKNLSTIIKDDKNFHHDMSQITKVAQSGRINNVGGDMIDLTNIEIISDQGDDLPYLTKISTGWGDNDMAERFNVILDEIGTYYRAIRLNINPVKLPVESYWTESWKAAGETFGNQDYGSITFTEDIRDIGEQMFKDMSYDLGTWEDGEWVPMDVSQYGESGTRAAWDRVTKGVFDITQLTLAVGLGNKATGVGKLLKFVDTARKGTKYYKNSSKWAKTVNDMAFGAFQTTTSFVVGEETYSTIIGNDVRMTVYRDENGELVFAPEIAIALGMGMPLWQRLQQQAHKVLHANSKHYRNTLNLNSKLVSETVKATGGGVSAATIIEIGEGVPLMITGQEAHPSISGSHKQDYLESILTFAAFNVLKRGPSKWFNAATTDVLNWKDPYRFQRNHLKVINMDPSTVNSEVKKIDKKIQEVEQNKDLSTKEQENQIAQLKFEKLKLKQKVADKDGIIDSDAIDKQTEIELNKTQKEINQVEKDLAKFKRRKNRKDFGEDYLRKNEVKLKETSEKLEKLKTKLNNITVSRRMLHSYNLEYEAKAIAKTQKKYSEYLKDEFIKKDNLFEELRRDPKNLTVEQLELIGNQVDGLTPSALNILYDKLNIKEGSSQQLYYDSFVNNIRESVHVLNFLRVPKGTKDRKNHINDKLEKTVIDGNIEILQDIIKKNPKTKDVNEIRIKKLKEQSKELAERMINRLDKFNSNFREELKRENDFLKEVIEGEGGHYKALNTKKFKKAVEKEGGKWSEDMDAFISADGRTIYVDKQKAFDVKDLTFGHHEIGHFLLYKLLKTTNAKGERVVSERGMKTIDYMLDRLKKVDPKGFELLQERIDLNYKYEIDIAKSRKASTTEPTIIYKKGKDGKRKEKKPETYYEEYITVLGQLIKNGTIKPTASLGKSIGKALYPWLGKRGPFKKMYEFDINQMDGQRAGKDLLKWIEWMGTKGFTENVLEVSRGQGITKGVPTISESRTMDINNQISKLKPGSKPIIENNTAIHDMLVTRASKKFGKDWRKVLSYDLKKGDIGYNESEAKEMKAKQKEFVEETSELRNAIVKNNENVAHWMAAHPKYGGKGQYKGITGDILIGKEKFVEKFKDELYELSRTYNPAKSNSPGAYLFETIRYRYPKIMEQLAPETRTKSITTEDGKVFDIKDVDADIYERLETENIIEIELSKFRQSKLQTEVETQVLKSKLRNEIGIENIHKSEILRKVEMDLRLTKAPIDITQKDFLKSLNKITENTHFEILSKTLPAEKMLQYKNVILESIPISQLVQMGKFLPQGNIFVKEHKHPTKTKWSTESNIQEFMGIRPEGGFTVNRTGKNLLPEMKKLWDIFSKMPQAKQKASPEYIEYKKKLKVGFPKIYERLEVKPNEWKTYLDAATKGKRQVAARSGTKGNNRDNILRKLSTALTKDAIPELLADKAFVDKYISAKDLQIEAKALVDKFINNIDRSQGLQFSKTKDIKTEIQTSADRIQGMYNIINKIAEVGVQNVYDFTPAGKKFEYKLKEEYKDWISNTEAKFVFENLILENKVFNHEGNVRVEKILEGINAGRKRSIGFEQFVINQFKGIKGLVLKTEVQTEKGDMADVPAEIAGKAFNVEVKMTKARLSSISGSHNIKNVESKISTKNVDNFRDRKQIESLLKESLKGWREISKYYKKLSKFPGISNRDRILLKNFNKNNSAIPEWAFNAALEAGVYNKARSKGIFTETLIEDLYKNKTNPSEYMLWLGKGLLHLGTNKFGLETTKLEGEFFGEWGHSKSSVKSEKTKHEAFITKENPKGIIDANGLITTSLRFIPTTKNVTSKNSKINVTTKKGLETFNNSVKNAKKIVEAENNSKKQIAASKSIKNTIDLVNGKVEKRGKSTFDFDDTVARTKSMVRYTTRDGKSGKLTAEEFASKGAELERQGVKFDFSEFDKVVDGKPGPFLEKLRERVNKYGSKDVFILTARTQQAAAPIREFLKSQGINIPLKNITGLADSSGNAKARWILEKFAEGYNDMYFVDDAWQNVKAVKKVLEQLDVKSKVVQAKIQFSKDISKSFNKMLERKSKIPAGKEISLAEAKILGRGKGRFDYFVPPSAEDLKGLMYKFLGKGRQGDADMRFFKEALFDPFAKGIRDHTIVKQKMVEEYKTLKKKNKDIKLNKEVEGTVFNTDAAIRVYLWNKAGFDIPGLSKANKKTLLDYVNNNPKLISFAETLGSISRSKEGYKEPGEHWMVESISSDLNDITQNKIRKEFLTEWIENKNILFSPENLNKIEAIEGKWYREALENMLIRMEKGTNRLHGIKDGPTKLWYDWINGSVGATMFWNTRSAMLQTISVANFTNMAENNPFAQAKAFANQKQFWKDFAFLFNSPMLKQRRAGLEIDVSASELTKVFEKSGRNPRSILKYMLEKGFTPTRIADSFAIALGGSAYYRNRVNKHIREGKAKVEAEKKAMLEFQEVAEETQQSSRPDLISQQQAGPLGRLVLAWQNTPMQMTRLMKKKLSDVVNRRRKPGQTQLQSDISNLMGIMYYGAVQNIWFATLQSGLGWLMFGSDLNDVLEEKEGKILNSAFDTLLRGTGVYGAAVSTFKNTILKYKEENEKGWKKDLGNVLIEAINLSPPMGSKARKLYGALKTWDYNDMFGDVSKEVGIDPSNPDLSAIANVTEAIFNVPLARLVNKANNIEEAMSGNHEWWQNTAMLLGWNRWNVGAKDEELEAARGTVKEEKKEKKKIEKEQEKKEEKEKEEKEKKEKGIKTVRCSGVSSSGQRCGNTTETASKTWKCYHHMDFTDGMDRDGDGIKEYRCTATKKNGDRCKNKTENKSKKCYAHQ